jgi:ribosomal protein S11
LKTSVNPGFRHVFVASNNTIITLTVRRLSIIM